MVYGAEVREAAMPSGGAVVPCLMRRGYVGHETVLYILFQHGEGLQSVAWLPASIVRCSARLRRLFASADSSVSGSQR